jgi:hypothetical protein
MTIALIYLIAFLPSGNITLIHGRDVLRRDIPEYAFDVQIGPEVKWMGIEASFIVNTRIIFDPEMAWTHPPYESIYTTNIGYRFSKEMKVGYEHQCIHPTLTRDYMQDVRQYGGYDKIYIEGRFSLHE